MRRAMLQENLDLLRQGLDLLERLGPEHYSKDHPVTGAGVGSHFRHVIDFYGCFLRDYASGKIDYDDRPRDAAVESDLVRARQVLQELRQSLSALDIESCSSSLSVRSDIPTQEGGSPAPSSPERELQVLASHTVHHYAIIALVLRLDEQPVPPEFGVAPSTLRYWKESRARTN